MTEDQPAAPGQPGFVRGNERLDQLLADPQLAADVAAAHADAEEMDRVYAMNLAMIRKAAQMTQVEVARKLGVGQGVVSRLEHRDDMLLSTLYDYLMATGAEGAGIVVIVHGHRIELDLSRLRNPPEQQSALAHRPRDVTLPQVITRSRRSVLLYQPAGPGLVRRFPLRYRVHRSWHHGHTTPWFRRNKRSCITGGRRSRSQ
jgi:transcriptional regulator with XRE-family HTH domain